MYEVTRKCIITLLWKPLSLQNRQNQWHYLKKKLKQSTYVLLSWPILDKEIKGDRRIYGCIVWEMISTKPVY